MGPGVCDRNGRCVSAMLNPCSIHGCEDKDCGEMCIMGDIAGWCDARGKCSFSPDTTKCGKSIRVNYTRG